MNLSLIVMFVYSRFWHSKKTIEAIKNNELASECEIFILADNAINNKKRNQVLKQPKRDTSEGFFQANNRVILE